MRYDVGRFRRPMRRGVMEQMVSLISLGDGSTLNLDFTTGVLDSRLTFTRGSGTNIVGGVTYVGSDGLVKYAGTNVPRFDHDPTTLAPKGLLIEGSASNVLQYSEAVDQSPWFTAGTVARATFTGGNGPNGVNNSGSKLSATSISSASSLYYNGLTLTAQTYTMSVFAKADGANWIWVNIQQGATIHGAFFDLSGNGALGNTTGTVVSGSNIITKYPNGWFRLQFSFTGTASSWFPVLLPCTSNGTGYASITGQAPNGVLVYGCQIETGSGASSYIATGASTATRVADNCSIHDTTTSGNLSWFKTATQGTFYVEAFKRTAGTTFAGAIIGTRANSGQDFILYQAVGNNWLSLNWGASEYVTNYSTLSSPFLIKAAVAFSPRTGTPTLADSLVSINGANSALNTTPNVALPFSSDLFCVGGRGSANGTVPTQNYAEVAIRRIKFFPTAMTAAQLNAMTTL